MRALVIDDSRTMRTIIRTILRDIDIDVVEARDGVHALSQVKANPDVSLMLVDWNMPVMDGLDFTKQIRAQPAYDHIRIMMVTSETGVEQVTRAMNAGANEYLMKPFSREVLIAKLDLLDVYEE